MKYHYTECPAANHVRSNLARALMEAARDFFRADDDAYRTRVIPGKPNTLLGGYHPPVYPDNKKA